jgi:predicted RNA-binding Zn-ribbon protein involved in translation (DUF1610 family)
MVVCPSCGSSRIRNDYKPAPLVLRAIGVRALLCDFCNRQFRAFSPAPPRTRAPRENGRKLDVSQTVVYQLNQNHTDPSREQIRLELEASRLSVSIEANQEQQIKVDLIGIPSVPPINEPQHRNGNGSVEPIQSGLRSEITRLHEVEVKGVLEAHGINVMRENQKSNSNCPECGSNWVRRRQRSGLERIVFALTNHKAFICRSCDASFYARVGEESESIMESSRSAQT